MLRMHAAVLNGVSLCLLLAGMSAIHKDVRGHVVNIVAGDTASELAIIAAPINDAVRVTFATLRDYQDGNSFLVLFALAAVALFAMLFRS